TGEGGMLVTDRDEIARRVLVLRDHGRQPGDTNFFNTEVAFKYRMSSMQTALGLAQLVRVDELIARKRAIFVGNEEEVAGGPGLALNAEPLTTKYAYWMVTVAWDSSLCLEKTDVKSQLSERGIDTRPFFHPLSSLPAYQSFPQARIARDRNYV